jgi:hypothetical protein
VDRNVMIFGGGAILVVGAAIAFVVATGDGGSESPAPATLPMAADDRPTTTTPAAPGGIDAEALARFGAWAEPLRAAGLTVTQETAAADGTATALTGLSITGPPDAIAWQLVMSSARIEPGTDARVTLRPTGPSALEYTVGGVTARRTIDASALRIDVERDSAGGARSVVVRARDLTIEGGNAPITLADGELRLALAEATGELVPVRSTATVTVRDLVLPGQAGGPLGTTISTLAADLVFDRGLGGWGVAAALEGWQLPGTGLSLANIQMDWGALDLTGTGTLTLDSEGRPAGRLLVEVADPLMVLDAFHVVLRFDRDLLADVYAALLQEIGLDPATARLSFTVAIADGTIVLVGADRGMPDIVLGTVLPLLGPAGP